MLPARLCEDFPEITVPLEPYTSDFAGVPIEWDVRNLIGTMDDILEKAGLMSLGETEFEPDLAFAKKVIQRRGHKIIQVQRQLFDRPKKGNGGSAQA